MKTAANRRLIVHDTSWCGQTTVKSILCIYKINRDHEDGIVQVVHPEYVEDS